MNPCYSLLNTARDTFLYPAYTALNRKENINVRFRVPPQPVTGENETTRTSA